MAEQTSRQAAAVASGKMSPGVAGGKIRVAVITSPASVTWADGDTLASPKVIPRGSRILCTSYVSCADMGTSIVAALGLRNTDAAGTEYDLDGIASSIDVATAATRAIANNGALVAAGVEHITTADTVPVLTLSGGTPTANAQIRVEIQYTCTD